MTRAPYRRWLIWATLLIACVLMLLPMPAVLVQGRPAWVAMVLIYWTLALPERVGVGVAFIAGLILDVLQGVLIGQNCLALMVVAFIAIKLHRRMRVYPLLQQSLLVLLMIGLHQLILLWLGSMSGTMPLNLLFLLPALTSATLWPWLFILLRDIRRHYRVR